MQNKLTCKLTMTTTTTAHCAVSARDAAFDNQIATFVLKISNLIIINNKGEITSTLKDLLKSMYVRLGVLT